MKPYSLFFLLTFCLAAFFSPVALLGKGHGVNWKEKLSQSEGEGRLVFLNEFYLSDIKYADSTHAENLLKEILYFVQEKEWKESEICTYILYADKLARHLRPNNRSESYYQKATQLAKEENLRQLEAVSLYKHGLYLYSSNLIPEAVVMMLSAREIANKYGANNIPYNGEYLYHLGRAYYDLNDLPKAKKLITESLDYQFQRDYYKMQALNTLCIIHAKSEEHQEAIAYCKEAMQSPELKTNAFWEAQLNTNLGSLFNNLQLYDSALNALLKAEQVLIKLEPNVDTRNLQFKNYLEIARTYFGLSNVNAGIYLEKGNLLVGSIKNFKDKKAFYTLLAKFNEQEGESKKAILHWKMANQMSDSLAKKLQNSQEQNIEVRIEAERQLTAATENFNYERSKGVYENILFIAFGSLAIMIALVLWLQLKSKKNQLLYKDEQVKNLEIAQNLTKQESLYLENALQDATKKLEDYAKSVKSKTEMIDRVSKGLNEIDNAEEKQKTLVLDELRKSTLLTNTDWDDFRNSFNKVYNNALYTLKIAIPNLSPADMRIICLMKIGLDSRQAANALGVTVEAVKKGRQRLRAKLEEHAFGKSLEELVESI